MTEELSQSIEKQSVEEKKLEYQKDVEARRQWHKMMNFHYLSYKGISLLNNSYSKELLESLGLQIHVPRTFMTIESIRPDLDRPLQISAKWYNHKEKASAQRSGHILNGEWRRSKSDKEKAKSEFDALLFGSGYLLNHFEIDEDVTEILTGFDAQGKATYETGKQVNYEGMKVSWLDPYYVIPDRKAKTYEPRKHTSPRRIWVPAIWDFNEWVKECKKKGYKTDGLKKGGMIEEFDKIRRTIDALYSRTLTDLKTRDNGVFISPTLESKEDKIDDNSIFVVKEYTPEGTYIYAGEDWTECAYIKNQLPKKEIPIYCLKDYDIPGELEGVGEAEVLRWQQYEENKVHNLMYLQVLLNTVKRYGIVEEMLVDPREARMTNPLKPIRLKWMPTGTKVNDAIQVLDQSSASDLPLNFINEIKGVGQQATGQTDYSISASKSEADTLGEAEMMNEAGGKRIKQKIQEMETRGITPILESWQAAIPRLYTEELDFLLNDGTNKDVKFLPYDRSFNGNAKLVADYATREGVLQAKTIEEVFLAAGYSDVVFVSDLVNRYDIIVKTSLAFMDKENTIKQYMAAIQTATNDNATRISMGMPPQWDTSKLTEELLKQFDEIIEDTEEYKLPAPAPAMMGVAPEAMPTQTASVPNS